MMNDLVPAGREPEERVLEDAERIERTQPLHPGHYWRAKKDVKHKGAKEPYIRSGCVLLLQRIKRVEEKPHAVELAGHPLLHPDSTFTLLVGDFLSQFDPEPRGAEIRAEEMRALQAEIDEKNRELLSFVSSPAALLAEVRKRPALPKPESRREEREGLPTASFDPSAGLPGPEFRPSTSIVALADGRDREQADTFRRQAENQAILAKTRSDLIQQRTSAIAETVKKLTPFYEEQGAVALAQAEDALDVYKKLKSGLATLGLYTGKDVELTAVRDGAPAEAEEPIHVLQALMFMDEESLINVSEGGADVRNLPDFVEQLRTDDALLKRLIPFPRGIVGMRYVHEPKFYENMSAFEMARMDDANSKCFLVIKNGARVTIVHSSLERIERLFPTQSDFEKPFTKPGWFRGIESENVTIDDLRITREDTDFSEARDKLDRLILHYRRILILLAGLYDRERDVIGEIAALSGRHGLAMLSLPMQEAIFRPISDEENVLGTGRPGFWDWLAEKNERVQPGSRVLCNWKRLMTAATAPAAVTRGERSDYFRYEPVTKFEVVVARREQTSLFVDAAVKGHTRKKYEEREFFAAVNLSLYRDSGLGYLCLDAVSPEEIDYYIQSRYERGGYIKYAPLLLAARDLLRIDRQGEAPMRRDLVDALQAGKVLVHGAEESELIDTVVRQWRAAHRGAPVPPQLDDGYGSAKKSMLGQLWILAGRGRDRKAAAEAIAAAEGREPLRLSLYGKNKLFLYATVIPAEREDLLGPHPWVCRLTLEELKTKVTVTDRRQVLLPKVDARESVLAEWRGVEEHVDPKMDHGLSKDEVSELRKMGDVALAKARRWLAPRGDEAFDADLAAIRADTQERSTRYITHGSIFIPLCVGRETRKESNWNPKTSEHETREVHKYHVGGISVRGVDALFDAATPKQKEKIRKWFLDYYNKPENALKNLGRDGRFEYVRVNEYPGLVASTFTPECVGSFAGKGKSWSGDARDFLAKLKAGTWHRADSSAMILRFDEVAAEVYGLLKGKGKE